MFWVMLIFGAIAFLIFEQPLIFCCLVVPAVVMFMITFVDWLRK